jgi:hypothetical protein
VIWDARRSEAGPGSCSMRDGRSANRAHYERWRRKTSEVSNQGFAERLSPADADLLLGMTDMDLSAKSAD